MYIFINKNAAGGRSIGKWAKAKLALKKNNIKFEEVKTSSIFELELFLKKIKLNEDTILVSAGGDGSIHTLINMVMIHYSEQDIQKIKIGAIALGSSNDFHKPFQLIDGLSLKVSPNTANYDLLKYEIEFFDQVKIIRYGIINASTGVGALGNYFFNISRVVKMLKKLSFEIANLYTLVNVLMKASSQEYELCLYQEKKMIVTQKKYFSNIGILKNKHVSGTMKYDSNVTANNHLVDIVTIDKVPRFALLKIMLDLTKGVFLGKKFTHLWSAQELTLSSLNPFLFEIDGEVFKDVKHVKCSVLPEHLKVCANLM